MKSSWMLLTRIDVNVKKKSNQSDLEKTSRRSRRSWPSNDFLHDVKLNFFFFFLGNDEKPNNVNVKKKSDGNGNDKNENVPNAKDVNVNKNRLLRLWIITFSSALNWPKRY